MQILLGAVLGWAACHLIAGESIQIPGIGTLDLGLDRTTR